MSFEIGESVAYKPPGGPVGVFVVLRRMPDDGSGVHVYRIKSGLEFCERCVMESALTKLESAPAKWREHNPP